MVVPLWVNRDYWLVSICHPRSGSFPSALNTLSKVWPWILIWAYLIWNFAPIFGQQISILDPPYIGLFGPSWSELSPYWWIAEGGGRLGLQHFFCHGRTETWLSRASHKARLRSMREARLKNAHTRKIRVYLHARILSMYCSNMCWHPSLWCCDIWISTMPQ